MSLGFPEVPSYGVISTSVAFCPWGLDSLSLSRLWPKSRLPALKPNDSARSPTASLAVSTTKPNDPTKFPTASFAVGHDEAAQSNEPPDQNSDPAAELRELTTNFDYLLGPENGEANLNDTATLDGGISDVADGNWNRDNFVQEWSDSYIGLRPDLSPEEAQAMAEARADRFQAGAERVLGNETLRNLVDAGRDGQNRLDGRFHLSDVLVVSELFGEEAGNAFETLNRLPRFCHSLDRGAVCWRTKREPGFEAMLTEVNNCGFESSVVCKLFASAVLV